MRKRRGGREKRGKRLWKKVGGLLVLLGGLLFLDLEVEGEVAKEVRYGAAGVSVGRIEEHEVMRAWRGRRGRSR